MHFKNPEVLYFLFLLIIPILIHLFQLQKYAKTTFTNVAFLKKLQQQNRKSSRLKKWLILCTRLFLLSAILFVFSQPYFGKKNTLNKNHTFIYLDNSLSLDTNDDKGNLLKKSIEEIIENASQKNTYTLITNNSFSKKIDYNELKNELLKIKITPLQLNINSVLLSIFQEKKPKTKTLNNVILISDFQDNYKNKFTNVKDYFSVVKRKSSLNYNISIDTAYTITKNPNNKTLIVAIKNQGNKTDKVPIALYNNNELVSKQTFSIAKDETKKIEFNISNFTSFLGTVKITYNDIFEFDNTYYFAINKSKKIRILSVGNPQKFISKIFNDAKFSLTNSPLKNIDYNGILEHQLIVLNSLEKIPTIFADKIIDFTKKGGTLLIIPDDNIDIDSYNNLFKKLNAGNLKPKVKDTLKVTTINFSHPLFKNVFTKTITNFQYPMVESYYPIINKTSSKILTLENGKPFISLLNKNIYFVCSSLKKENSNFINSPLIVPTFYNIGISSFNNSKLAYVIGKKNKIEVKTKLKKDEVLSLINNKNKAIIPLQQSYYNKVIISTSDEIVENGFQTIAIKGKSIKNIAFNNPKEESLLNFLDLKEITKNNQYIQLHKDIPSFFNQVKKNNEVQWLWKWFLIIAIVSLLLEILILKFFKP